MCIEHGIDLVQFFADCLLPKIAGCVDHKVVFTDAHKQ
jgi:hypothetical protein